MFKNDPSLRGVGEIHDLTPELQNEYIRCMTDPIYFAQHFVYINTLDRGPEIVKLREYQKKILKEFVDPHTGKRHAIIMQPRQSGKCFLNGQCIKTLKNNEIRDMDIAHLINN